MPVALPAAAAAGAASAGAAAGGAVVGGAAAGAAATAATGLTLGAIATEIAIAIAQAAIGLGLSALQSKLFDSSSRPSSVSLVPVREVIRQSTPFERYVYGRALVGGAFSYWGKQPPYRTAQYLIAAHQCDAVEAVYINGFRCVFNSINESVTPRFRAGGVPFIEINTRLGTTDQVLDTLLASEFPDIPSTFRQRGHTTVTLKAYYGADFTEHEEVYGSGGAFSPLFLVRGKLIYDPRIYSHDVDDATTWAWSDNWALCIADWMRSSYGGRKPSSQIDWEAVAEAADLCDQAVGLAAGGSEKRYTMNGGFTSDESPFQVLEQMLACAGDASALWRRGQFAPHPDVIRTPVRTLTQADLISGIAVTSGKSRGELLNQVQSQFVMPTRDYKAAVTPPLQDAAALASDGQLLEAVAQRPFVAGHERAQRLDKLTLKRSRLGRRITFAIGREHLDLEVGDQIRLEFEDFPTLDGAYDIRYARLNDTLQAIELTVDEAAPSTVHEWSTSEVQSTDLVEIIDPEAV